MFNTLMRTKFLHSLDHIQYGSLTLTTPDGMIRHFSGKHDGPKADLSLHDWSVVSHLAARGDIAFAEDYQNGLWDTTDLTALLTLGLVNEQAIQQFLFGSVLARLAERCAYFFQRNTLRGSRRNIQAHYDLGNSFYKLWLDPGMTYSSAIFSQAERNSIANDLLAAQNNKYDRIIDCLAQQSGRLLEIGCGWGGFAERAIERGDYEIKGVTLSDEQHDYAKQRLQGKADIVLEDYRHQSGIYDRIVSIEMFEAVGEQYWPTYFDKIASLLKRSGKAVVQTITIDDKIFDRYRKGTDVIRSHIFPGGMLPSPERFKNVAAKSGLQAGNEFHFGQDYATTMEHWLDRFDQQIDQISALGYDYRFIRLWRFYLASCIAGFRTNRIGVMQVELQHAA